MKPTDFSSWFDEIGIVRRLPGRDGAGRRRHALRAARVRALISARSRRSAELIAAGALCGSQRCYEGIRRVEWGKLRHGVARSGAVSFGVVGRGLVW